MRIADRRQQLVLGVRVPVDERHRRHVLDRCATEEPIDDGGRVGAGRREVVAPLTTTIGQVDAAQEARDHLAQLVQHQLGVVPGPPGADGRASAATASRRPDRCRRSRRSTSTPPAGCRAWRRAPWPASPGGTRTRCRRRAVGSSSRTCSVTAADRRAVGVEHAVHVADVAGAEPARQHVRIAVVAVAPAEAGVVGDVARALLEVAHQATPLEDLGQHVRRLLAGQVHAAQLGDGVVAVLEEHLLVQLLGPFETDRGVDRLVAGDVEIADELVEEQPPQALRAAAVAGEQGPLHDLREVDEGEHRPVEVGEVAPEDVALLGGEVLRHVDSHGASC